MLRGLSTAVFLVLIFCFLIVASGCSVVMAVRQPPYKDLTMVKKGITRGEVIAELGIPLFTEEKDGEKKDIFAFRQGYGKGNKALRALFHTAADVFTLFLWEVIGTPTEMIASGREVKMEVFYDKNDYVKQANILSGQKVEPKEEPKEKLQAESKAEDAKVTRPKTNFGY